MNSQDVLISLVCIFGCVAHAAQDLPLAGPSPACGAYADRVQRFSAEVATQEAGKEEWSEAQLREMALLLTEAPSGCVPLPELHLIGNLASAAETQLFAQELLAQITRAVLDYLKRRATAPAGNDLEFRILLAMVRNLVDSELLILDPRQGRALLDLVKEAETEEPYPELDERLRTWIDETPAAA